MNLVPETPTHHFAIRRENGNFHVVSPSAEIDGKKAPLKFQVTLKKLITPIEEGAAIEIITIDNESSKLQQMRKEAQDLKQLPERERIRPLLQIVKQNLQYAFPWVMEKLARENPQLAAWVKENTGVQSWMKPLTLSQVVDAGYGICRHLSVAMLTLAKDAGLEGAHLTYQPVENDPSSLIKNVTRKDNGKPLFMSVGVNEPFESGHAWIELRTSDGEWIPIDPSTELVGDTPEGLATFHEANYQVNLSQTVITKGLPEDVYGIPTSSLQFRPGEETRTGLFVIGGRKSIIIPKNQLQEGRLPSSAPPEIRYGNYHGPLDFQLVTQLSYKGTTVEITNVS